MTDASQNEQQLFPAVQAYLQELEKGRRPDRQEWLARYPQLAPELGKCLDGLVLVHEGAAALGSAPRPVPELGVGLESGIPIGDFQIVREIGRGGMGIIYEAIQLSLGRRVALKVLPLAAGFDTKYLQRFRQEAQAAAQLHHNYIVPVYAVGCERGTHFYAMQLIDGLSLDRIIHELRRDAGISSGDASGPSEASSRSGSEAMLDVPPTEAFTNSNEHATPTGRPKPMAQSSPPTLSLVTTDLSTERSKGEAGFYRLAAELMAQAAEALEYAHQQGIVHRDIKPGNLMIDGHRHLWITDFGLAHLHNEQNLTRTGDMVGTLRYASPEQVSGLRVVLDHRTDLYSLGATFYELLTLQPVFAGPNRHTLLHQVLNQQPVSPRSLQRSIPPELETILLKLLCKSPSERYDSAQELADDLRRFLRHEPIVARPPGLLERMRKWGQRHPAYVGAVVVVMSITLLASGVSNWLVTQANRRTQAALQAERTRAEEAEQRFAQAREAVDLLIEISENDLDVPPLQPLQKRLLELALVYYQEFIAQHADNPAREAELQTVQVRLRKVLDDLSVMQGAGQLVLLEEKSVQEDLMLGEEDKERIDAIARQFAKQRTELMRGYQHLNPTERRERFLELARANERLLSVILHEPQLRRLRQIRLQLMGLMAFNQPETVQLLQLTDSQRRAIRQIEVEVFLLFRDGPDPKDEEARRDLREALFNSAMDKSLVLLAPDQLEKWKKWIGPAFRGRLSNPPPGMPPIR